MQWQKAIKADANEACKEVTYRGKKMKLRVLKKLTDLG